MHVLIVTNYYPPEIGGAAHLSYELAQSLKARGHQVTVLTGYPRYNAKDVPARYRRGLWIDENSDGVRLQRIRVPSLPRTSKIARGIEHFVVGIWLSALMGLARRGDVAMVYSPPLPLPWLVSLIGRVKRLRAVVNVQDLFPAVAVELGMLTNPMLIRLFEVMERQVYRLASAVTVHSSGNKAYVSQRGGHPMRVHVIHNWVDTDHIQPGERDNAFALQHGLTDRFVVSYAGTMGWCQDMNTIVRSAALLRDYSDVLFLMVGDGVEKEKAQNTSLKLGLHNILWLPTQPWSVYPQVLAASDVSMINLNRDLRTPVVPSKLHSIMAAGRPVVASLPEISDARQMVADAGCGICVEAGDSEALAGAILDLENDRELAAEMGRRGRVYAEAHFAREVCIDQLETVLTSTEGET
jgi:glycosyltransferase involved in cell wall biosynthesis